MNFDQNMIIDATKGSIARFVNHSCQPNCRMVKWIVGGKPRMALFAGDAPIMTGEELTYDYNFDPFSAKNVQQCRCGSENCRGILGPRKDVKPVKEAIKDVLKAGVQAGKRKLKAMLAGEEDSQRQPSPKKRKLKKAIGVKRSASSTGLAIGKSVKVVKANVTRRLSTAKSTVVKSRASFPAAKGSRKMTGTSSRSSSLTLVAADTSTASERRKKFAASPKTESIKRRVSTSSTKAGSVKRRVSTASLKLVSNKPATTSKVKAIVPARRSSLAAPTSTSEVRVKRKYVRKSTGSISKTPSTDKRSGLGTRASSGSPFKHTGKSTKFFEQLLDETEGRRSNSNASDSASCKQLPKIDPELRQGLATRASSGSPHKNKSKSTKFFADLLDGVQGKKSKTQRSKSESGAGNLQNLVKQAASIGSVEQRQSTQSKLLSTGSTLRLVESDD